MKPSFFLVFVLITGDSFGQAILNDKVVIEATTNYKPANIKLLRGEHLISILKAFGGKITIKDGLETGFYHVVISAGGQAQPRTDSIFLQKGQTLELNIHLGGPCLYDHPTDQTPICPEKHADKIIPIVYGLIAPLKGSKNVEVRLGGCLVTDCDPKYYCTIHKIEF